MERRLVGLQSGAADIEKLEAQFTLSTSDGKPLRFVAKLGVAEQITAALARICTELRAKAARALGAAEQVAGFHVHREAMHDAVMLRIQTPQGVVYTFAMEPRIAVDMAASLKAEGERSISIGRS